MQQTDRSNLSNVLIVSKVVGHDYYKELKSPKGKFALPEKITDTIFIKSSLDGTG